MAVVSERGATPVGGLPNYILWGHGDVMYDLHNVANKTLNFGPILEIFELTFAELSDESHYMPKFYVSLIWSVWDSHTI